MTERLLDDVTINAGNSVTAELGKQREDAIAFGLAGDSDATDIDVTITGVGFDRQTTPTYVPTNQSAQTGIDASNADRAFVLAADGFIHVSVTVTNNNTTATTVTLDTVDYTTTASGFGH